MQEPIAVAEHPTFGREPTAAADSAMAAADAREYRFRFTGSGGEYFSIWIVNLLLSILTLGVYSAWAKVRREQYFCRNTLLDDHSFDYTADPVRILIGRAIALTIVVVGSFAQEIDTTAAVVVTIAFALAFPWIVVTSLRFRARNTRYRNIAFQFTGSAAEAVKVFLWIYVALLPVVAGTIFLSPELPTTPEAVEALNPEEILSATGPLAGSALLSLLLAAALWPAYERTIKAFLHRNVRFGNAQGDFDGDFHDFYRAASRISAISLFAWIVAVASLGVAFSLGQLWPAWIVAGAYFLSRAAYTVVFTNITFARASLAGQRFGSDMRIGAYALLLVTNALILLLTLGLASPWARVRHARYRLAHTYLLATPGAVDTVMAGAEEDAAAFGEEAADFLDFDVSL